MGPRREVGRVFVRAGVALVAVLAVAGCESPPSPTAAAARSGQSATGPSIAFPVPAASGAAVPTAGGAPKGASQAVSPTPASGGSRGATASGGQEAADRQVTVTGQIQTTKQASARIRTASGSTTMAWDGATAILDTTSSKRENVRKGACVVASTALLAPGEERTGPGGADEVAWVLLSRPLDGHCPTVAPQAPGSSGAARIVSGLVTGVKGSVVTLETVGVGRPKAQARIALATKATIAETSDATSAVVRKGRCVVVVGTRDATGRLVATSLTLSDPGKTGCPL